MKALTLLTFLIILFSVGCILPAKEGPQYEFIVKYDSAPNPPAKIYEIEVENKDIENFNFSVIIEDAFDTEISGIEVVETGNDLYQIDFGELKPTQGRLEKFTVTPLESGSATRPIKVRLFWFDTNSSTLKLLEEKEVKYSYKVE